VDVAQAKAQEFINQDTSVWIYPKIDI
jgi:hypothetical protein